MHRYPTPQPVVVNLDQLREALRIAEDADRAIMEASEFRTDSAQIHLTESAEGMLHVEFLSNERGLTVARFEIDPGSAPGETGRATEVVGGE